MEPEFVIFDPSDMSDPENVFPDVKKYLYSENCDITLHNAVGLLAFAQRLQIKDLMKQTQIFPNNIIRKFNGYLLSYQQPMKLRTPRRPFSC